MFNFGFFEFLTIDLFCFLFTLCEKVTSGRSTPPKKLCGFSMKPDIIQDLAILQTDIFKIPGQKVIGYTLLQDTNVASIKAMNIIRTLLLFLPY